MERVAWKYYLQLLSNKYGVDLIKMTFARAKEFLPEKEFEHLTDLMKYQKPTSEKLH